ncbi:MAG: 2-C-methyl-D-erythritol 4-phosphate cytidylyltransferase [Chloroflexi bacterium]|nr:MAG: 2-C-methyl-D-erythritol 4-phosphate cytidylyltransferase [Chloroflexota bacterium]
MQDVDKVWAQLAGKSVVERSLLALALHVHEIVVVVRPDMVARAEKDLAPLVPSLRVVIGGELRRDSVHHGLKALHDVDVVAVHDAARPLVKPEVLRRGLELMDCNDGAVPVVPLHDTIKRIDQNGLVVETLDRSRLVAAQTPQVFSALPLRNAYLNGETLEAVTDDAMLLESRGFVVATFPGDAWNFKITTRHDLELARLLLTTQEVR